jgi:hypothetical protein
MLAGDGTDSSAYLLGACGRMWLCLVLPGIKWHHYPRTLALWPFARYLGHPRASLSGSWAHVMLGCEDQVVWANRWQNLACPRPLRWGKDWCRLLPSLVLFILVAPPLRPGVVGSYQV